MQRLVFRVCARVVGKPSGGGKREPPPPPCACVWWPMSRAPRLMGTVVGARADASEEGKETIYGTFRTEVDTTVMAVWLSGLDPSRETNDVDITSCSQYANTMSSTKKE